MVPSAFAKRNLNPVLTSESGSAQVVQVPQVDGQASGIPTRAQRAFVDVLATHSQEREIRVPSALEKRILSVESTHGEVVADVGDAVGDAVGVTAAPVGDAVGDAVGVPVGDAVGDAVGLAVGVPVGDAVGPIGAALGEGLGLIL